MTALRAARAMVAITERPGAARTARYGRSLKLLGGSPDSSSNIRLAQGTGPGRSLLPVAGPAVSGDRHLPRGLPERLAVL